MSKTLLLVTGLMALAFSVSATPAPAPVKKDLTLEQKRDEKFQEAWFKAGPWITDYDKARAESKASGKPIFAYFTRSYAACGFCAALEKGALSEPDFQVFAKDVVLFCHITSQVPGEPYPDLFQQKGGKGFPHLAFLDAEGEVLLAHSGARTVEKFRRTAEKVQAYRALQRKAAGGDKAAGFDLLVAGLEMGRVTFEEGQKEVAASGDLTPERKAALVPALAAAEVRSVVATLDSKDEAACLAAGKHFLDMKLAGRIPTGEVDSQPFWVRMMNYAAHEKNPALFEEGLVALKTLLGDNPQAKAFFVKRQAQLDALKAGR